MTTLATRAWIAAAVFASSACSMSWDVPSPVGVDADGGSRLSGDAALASVQIAPEGGASNADGGVGGDASGISDCGPNTPCAPGLVCHYPDHLCGKGAAGGRCVAPATNCADMPKVCGCDGTIYQDQCTANHSAQDVSAQGNCAPPPSSGDYACGYVFCWYPGLLPAQYCRHHTSATETTYDCPFAPPSCNSWNCNGCSMSGCGLCQTLTAGGWMFDCP